MKPHLYIRIGLLVAAILAAAFTAKSLYDSNCARELNFAIIKNDEAMINKYLGMSWDVNAKFHGFPFESKGFFTALGTACFRKHFGAVKTLLDRGADPNLFDYICPVANLFYLGGQPNNRDILPTADLLFEHGADVSGISGRYSPLSMLRRSFSTLAYFNEQERMSEFAIYLILKGADYSGAEMLKFSAQADSISIIKCLVESAGYSYDQSDAEAIIGGARNSSYESVEYILKNCPQFDKGLKDADGKTAMDYAKENGDLRMMEILTGN